MSNLKFAGCAFLAFSSVFGWMTFFSDWAVRHHWPAWQAGPIFVAPFFILGLILLAYDWYIDNY